jgi:hypothetical protein
MKLKIHETGPSQQADSSPFFFLKSFERKVFTDLTNASVSSNGMTYYVTMGRYSHCRVNQQQGGGA